MSEHMKRPRTRGAVRSASGLSSVQIKSSTNRTLVFNRVPKDVISSIRRKIDSYREKTVPWRDAFKKDIQSIGEGALALRGARAREGMTQKKLARLLGTSQVYISQLENGKKEINKQTAIKLGTIFNIDYKVFL